MRVRLPINVQFINPILEPTIGLPRYRDIIAPSTSIDDGMGGGGSGRIKNVILSHFLGYWTPDGHYQQGEGNSVKRAHACDRSIVQKESRQLESVARQIKNVQRLITGALQDRIKEALHSLEIYQARFGRVLGHAQGLLHPSLSDELPSMTYSGIDQVLDQIRTMKEMPEYQEYDALQQQSKEMREELKTLLTKYAETLPIPQKAMDHLNAFNKELKTLLDKVLQQEEVVVTAWHAV